MSQTDQRKKLDITLSIDVYDRPSELAPEYASLLKAAEKITHQAYAPYSNFLVGAAILLDDGTVVTGSNQENAAYPSGICAERTAIYYTGAQYPNRTIKAIAVAAQRGDEVFLPAAPCGACRQAMLEYEEKQPHNIQLILQGQEEKVYVVSSIADLLPLKFGKKNLNSGE
ncbi:cytidine deaminase [Microscilla marina]|uniref:Cytidine deaminase n=1 Tax=Microscilla marina ATCC 23134 TaxID=313606 RepID=A1ZMX8_MICM2|nr:cytidine deaminase [Microscilla marina]EAY28159.1 cytidine deaminase [Microscilla marina ATCC 23134]